jgi:hypothetical protein
VTWIERQPGICVQPGPPEIPLGKMTGRVTNVRIDSFALPGFCLDCLQAVPSLCLKLSQSGRRRVCLRDTLQNRQSALVVTTGDHVSSRSELSRHPRFASQPLGLRSARFLLALAAYQFLLLAPLDQIDFTTQLGQRTGNQTLVRPEPLEVFDGSLVLTSLEPILCRTDRVIRASRAILLLAYRFNGRRRLLLDRVSFVVRWVAHQRLSSGSDGRFVRSLS